MQVVPLFEPTLPGHQNDIVGFTYHIYIYPIVINGINSVQLILTNVIYIYYHVLIYYHTTSSETGRLAMKYSHIMKQKKASALARWKVTQWPI